MDKPTGARGSMEYGKFRLNRMGEPVVAVSNEDEVKVKTIVITDSGNTAFIPAEAGKAIRVRGFVLSREGGSAATISLREDSDGDLKYSVYLKTDGDNFQKDLSHIWALSVNKPLYVYASEACNVHVTVEYDGPDEATNEGETLADAMSIAESVNFTSGKKVTDAITFAEAEIESSGKKITDTQTITDSTISRAWVGALGFSESMSVSESVVESWGQPLTKSLTDSITFSEDAVQSQS